MNLTQSKIKIPKRVKKVQLCQECIGGYNKIIDKANKEIKAYLKEGKEKEKKEEPKRKRVLVSLNNYSSILRKIWVSKANLLTFVRKSAKHFLSFCLGRLREVFL